MRIAPAMLAIFASVLVLPFITPLTPVAAVEIDHRSAHCTKWSSTTQPPPTIRVYRVSEGKVDTVDFRTYVIRVMSREWGVPQMPLRMAGAVAVKQFAWFHVLHYRGGRFHGQCYDVKDTTADQLYSNKPLRRIPGNIKTAVKATWSWTVWRGDKFPMTGYRQGRRVRCAKDAAYRLYVRSARRCSSQGWSAERILATYYSATVKH